VEKAKVVQIRVIEMAPRLVRISICLLGLALAVPAYGQKPAAADDPFAETNRASAQPVPAEKAAEKPEKAAEQPPAKRTPVDDRIDFEFAVSPKQVRRGETFKLTITGTPRPGFHTYPLRKHTPEQGEAGLSKLSFQDTPGLKPLLDRVTE